MGEALLGLVGGRSGGPVSEGWHGPQHRAHCIPPIVLENSLMTPAGHLKKVRPEGWTGLGWHQVAASGSQPWLSDPSLLLFLPSGLDHLSSH